MSDSKRQQKAHRQARLLAISVGAILGPCLVAGIAILGFAAWIAWTGTASKHWPKADAVIRSADVVEELNISARGRPSRSYRASIVFEYSVGDRQYQSDRVSLLDSLRRGDAMDLVARFEPGLSTQVYYDPTDPAVSLLVPGIPSRIWIVVATGAIFLLVPMAIAIPVVRKYRRLRSTGSNQSTSISPRPKTALVEVMATPMELVVHVRPGRQGASTAGGIAAIGIGLAFFFAVFFLPDLLQQKRWTAKFTFLLVGFGGMLLVGLWQLASYLRLRFEKQTLRITAREAVLDRRLAGIVRSRRAQLADGAAARLAWDHDADHQPVYAVIIEGADRPLRFATSLPNRDKQQLVQQVNKFLGVETPEPLADPTKS